MKNLFLKNLGENMKKYIGLLIILPILLIPVVGLGIATAAGITLHAVSTNIQKRREIRLGDSEEE